MAQCPICSTYIEDNKFLEKYISQLNNQEYKLYHCPQCDLQWWEPLKMIPEFYENEKFEMYKSFHLGIRKKLPYYQKFFFKKNPLGKGKLLDIGCGDGLFLEYAEKAGYEVYGIDLDKKSVKIAMNRLNKGQIFAMSLDDFVKKAKNENLKFDIITFFEVLEHQDNPNKFLQNVKLLLKSGGIIAGSVPNRDSFFQKKMYREIYDYIDYPPHHFLRFSRSS
jgi:2-polyprenyl-3-methyl-5-hydroxy-6-metoxy-1,4-benzoquinol methylase